MSLLTTNQLVFSVDSRLSVSYDKNTENWGLVIQSAQERDSASYLCQVRTAHGLRSVSNSHEVVQRWNQLIIDH